MKHQCAAVFDYNSLFHAYAMYDIIIKGSVNSKLEQPTVSLKGPGEISSTNIIIESILISLLPNLLELSIHKIFEECLCDNALLGLEKLIYSIQLKNDINEHDFH